MDSCVAYQLDADKLGNIGIVAPSATFHGRDIFAPVAAEIAAGRLQAADLAIVTDQWTPGWIEEPQVSNKQVSGVVVTIDAFGNLICNIERHHVAALQNPVVQIAGNTFEMAATYGRVQPGSYLALINSFDVLEIARSEGNAAEGLGSDRGAPVIVRERSS